MIDNARVNGSPNAGYVGTVLAMDEATFADRSRDGRYPLEYIEEIPKVVLLFRDSTWNPGWKFRGIATVHRDSSESDDVITYLVVTGLIFTPETKTAAVVLQIHQVLTLFGEVLQERVPGMSW